MQIAKSRIKRETRRDGGDSELSLSKSPEIWNGLKDETRPPSFAPPNQPILFLAPWFTLWFETGKGEVGWERQATRSAWAKEQLFQLYSLRSIERFIPENDSRIIEGLSVHPRPPCASAFFPRVLMKCLPSIRPSFLLIHWY